MSSFPSPLVSVIIPTYNRASLITQAVDSVLAQSYRAVEIIVVDDGSTDETEAVLARYGHSIRVIHQPNRGRSEARNSGLQAARGDLVAWLDSDNYWHPGKLAAQVDYLESHPDTGLVFTRSEAVNLQGKVLAIQFPDVKLPHRRDLTMALLRRRLTVDISTVLVRQSVLARTDGFCASLWLSEDVDLLTRLSQVTHFGCIEAILSAYRIHAGQTVQQVHAREVEAQGRLFLASLLPRLALSPQVARWITAEYLLRWAYHHARDGNGEKAVELLFDAVRRHPALLVDYRLFGIGACVVWPRISQMRWVMRRAGNRLYLLEAEK